MRNAVLLATTAAILGACAPAAPSKLDKWSWLPRTTRYDAEAATIARDDPLRYFIPKDEPLDAGSDGGWGGIDTFGNFVPKDKKSYVVKGGALVSSVGKVERRAKFGDWDVVFADAARTQRAGWGHCLTSGEILVPRAAFADPPPNHYVQNLFAIETFGEAYLLIKLNPAQNHRLCFLEAGTGQALTAGYLGSRAIVGPRTLERKADGWYSGATRFSN